MEKRWIIERQNQQLVTQLQDEFALSAITAKILVARGYTTSEQVKTFLSAQPVVHDPLSMHGMQEAVTLIEEVIAEGGFIRVYGDYDTDGITSTTVLVSALRDQGAEVDYVIPNRFIHGYGPNEQLFREAYADGVSLLITVDNGIAGVQEVKVAKELGLKVIITDHHEPGEALPDADVILHPRIPEGHYPFGELAGVGVSFKLAHALYKVFPTHLVALVALGTVADLVPLVDENRTLVKQGLAQLQQSDAYWLRAFCEVAQVEQSKIDEDTLGFQFAPRLNAVGRLQDAVPGVDFLLSESLEEAKHLAHLLDDCNQERKAIVQRITDEAIAQVEAEERLQQARVLVVTGEDWNAGVVGIVASRLVERFYKPTIVLGIDEAKQTAKGSARSIAGFNLYEALAKNAALLTHFGGHPMAAGMTLPAENVETLFTHLNEQAQSLTEEQLTPVIHIDIALTIDDITIEAIEQVRMLAPFGTAFPKPTYALEKAVVADMRKIGQHQKHLKMTLESNGQTLDTIGFNNAHYYDEITYQTPISLVGDLQINEWQGRKKPQFLLRDIQINTWQLFDVRGITQTARWASTVAANSIGIAFHETTLQYFDTLLSMDLQLAEQVHEAEAVVLLDLPPSEEALITCLQRLQPKKVYAHFHAPKDTYFNALPTREQFAWYYKFLNKRPNFALKQHMTQLATHMGWQVDTIKFMTKVFFELGFVKIDNGLTTVVTGAIKTPLEQAPSYQQRLTQIALEQQFVYAPYAALKQWFDDNVY